MRLILLLLFATLLAGCQARADPPATLYDFTLQNDSGQTLTPLQASAQLENADVIMVGELHGHAGVHHFQAELLAALLTQPRPLALAMEQFSRDKQQAVDDYLAGKLGGCLYRAGRGLAPLPQRLPPSGGAGQNRRH